MAGEHLADDRRGRAGRDPAPEQLGGELVATPRPQLARVRLVERVGDGGPESSPHRFGERHGRTRSALRHPPPYGCGHGIGDDAYGEPLRRVPHEVDRSQRKVEPSSLQPDAASTRPPLEPDAELLEIDEEIVGDRRVQAVAAEVDRLSVDRDGSGEAADVRRVIEHRHRVAAPRRVPRGGEAGGTGTEHDDVASRGDRRHDVRAYRRRYRRIPCRSPPPAPPSLAVSASRSTRWSPTTGLLPCSAASMCRLRPERSSRCSGRRGVARPRSCAASPGSNNRDRERSASATST